MDWASTGGRYTYEFMFDESPESATEEKELRAMEILDEEAILKIWETPGATKEDKEEHLRMLGFLLPRDIEKIAISHYWDFWLVPDPEPGDRTELVARGIGNTPLVPGYLKQKTDKFIRLIHNTHLVECRMTRDSDSEYGWYTVARHVYYLIQDYLFTQNSNSKLELEQFLRTVEAGGYNGSTLGVWIDRKIRGEWDVVKRKDPPLLPHLRKRAQFLIRQFAALKSGSWVQGW
ncbi:hypothetical protein BZA05DRAFT_87781 [Tricharina praecox]|uniref:uncharacterized protein n=1 Tax=Tricharina praecox TaxID=43433 RepID=UPI00221F0875|nr:uncharacterized protein BZA05DRAFT_87781 [Tricharina praecox]KAI5848818.1 hypothetical protein BZA05DRAFT_87781 [Tricharina praecox]